MIDFEFYPENNLIISIFYGKMSSQELNEFIDRLLKIENIEGGMRGLVIFCKNIRLDGIKYSDIYSAGKKMHKAPFRKNGKNAIIANTKLGYTIAKMYQSVTEVVGLDETKVFKGYALKDATEWLGIAHFYNQLNELIERCESAIP